MNSTKAEHTPGPWEVNTLGGRLPVIRKRRQPHGEAPTYSTSIRAITGGQHVCVLDFGYGQPVDTANALVIAAAPDLLNALKLAESVYRLNVVHVGEPSTVLDAMQAAIAKAEGTLATTGSPTGSPEAPSTAD